MTQSTAIKIGIGALIIIACISGLILTELQQQNYQANLQILQKNQQELDSLAPQIYKNALQNLQSAQTFEITDTQTLDIIGCQFKTTYTGVKTGKEEAAQSSASAQNHSIILSKCTDEFNKITDIYNLSGYWKDNKSYTKLSKEPEFTETASGSAQLIIKPSEYIYKYFKAYRPDPKITNIKQNNDNTILLDLTDTEDNKTTTYHLTVSPAQTITSISYETSEQGSLSYTTGKISLNYEPTRKPQDIYNQNPLDSAWIKDNLHNLENTIILTIKDSTIEIGSKTMDIHIDKQDDKADLNCRLQYQDCYNKYEKIISLLEEYIDGTNNKITKGACTDLRKLSLDQINHKDRLTTLTIQDTKTNLLSPKIEITTDTQDGKTIITKYGFTFTCYETHVPKEKITTIPADTSLIIK